MDTYKLVTFVIFQEKFTIKRNPFVEKEILIYEERSDLNFNGRR